MIALWWNNKKLLICFGNFFFSSKFNFVSLRIFSININISCIMQYSCTLHKRSQARYTSKESKQHQTLRFYLVSRDVAHPGRKIFCKIQEQEDLVLSLPQEKKSYHLTSQLSWRSPYTKPWHWTPPPPAPLWSRCRRLPCWCVTPGSTSPPSLSPTDLWFSSKNKN